jgi:hypothetical protein
MMDRKEQRKSNAALKNVWDKDGEDLLGWNDGI